MASTERQRASRLSPALPLAMLIGHELHVGGSEHPALHYGNAGFAKRGEDYFLIKPNCLRVPGDPSTAFSIFAVFDGHNGVSAAVFNKERLLEHVMSALPSNINAREDWLQALLRALVSGFVKANIDFQSKGEHAVDHVRCRFQSTLAGREELFIKQ